MKGELKKYVYYHNKKSGTTYVIENYSYWDKNLKQPRSKRKYIGTLNKETNEIILSKGRKRTAPTPTMIEPPQLSLPKRWQYGATYLLHEIAKKLGIVDDLKRCFQGSYKQILSIAYYLILEDNNPLSRFPNWDHLHLHPYGRNIPSQRSSDLFASISEVAQSNFFHQQHKRHDDTEYYLYDITSISSYSETLRLVQWGHNKDNDRLPQINLAYVYGAKSGLPIYFRKLAGNIPDVKTVKTLLGILDGLGYKNAKLNMDRGFYKEDNIHELYKEGFDFLVATKTSLVYVRDYIDLISSDLNKFQYYDVNSNLYGYTITTNWDYSEKCQQSGEKIKSKKDIYVHIYYNPEKALESERKLNKKIAELYKELQTGKPTKKHEKQYATYFNVKKVSGKTVFESYKDDIINKTKRYYGYFVFLSNEVSGTWQALTLYRNRDIVEKAFNNFKDRLNMNRLLVSSEKSLEGKLFVGHIALIRACSTNQFI